ncbi:P1 family peptidase [Deinococcus marmoris]|uniref:P1 family peptidase n=1 Tax=Deinococcus marmoris TaxID=249408 RepID=UPI001B80979B
MPRYGGRRSGDCRPGHRWSRRTNWSPLFQAVVEATEEALLNALCRAVPMDTYDGRRIEALPLEMLARLEAARANPGQAE